MARVCSRVKASYCRNAHNIPVCKMSIATASGGGGGGGGAAAAAERKSACRRRGSL